MARDHGRILTRIWNDPDWRTLPPEPQRLYMLLLSQAQINHAGVLPLMVGKWAKGSSGTSTEDVAAALAVLIERSYVVIDDDTEELLVRSFIRNDGVAKHPNTLKAAMRAASAVESARLRKVLAEELRRLGLKDADRVANTLDSEPIANPSRTVPDGIANPSGRVAKPVDNSTHRDGIGNPSRSIGGGGRGGGRGSSPVGGSVGEHAPAEEPGDERPSEHCSKHPGGTTDACRRCQAARQRAEAWDTRRAERREAIAAELEQARCDRRLECDHGTPGGLHPHPDTGLSATCAQCRAREVTS